MHSPKMQAPTQQSQSLHDVPGQKSTDLRSFNVDLSSEPLNPWKLMSCSAIRSAGTIGFLSVGCLTLPLASQNWATKLWTASGRQSAQLHSWMWREKTCQRQASARRTASRLTSGLATPQLSRAETLTVLMAW